jgi:hypothetical protein
VICSDLVDVQYLVFPDEPCMVRPLRIQTVKDSMALLKDGWGFGRMMLVLEIPERPGYYMVFDGVHRLAGIYQMQAAPHIYPQWASGMQKVAIQVFDSKMPLSAMKRLGIAHTFRVREVGYSTHLSRERGDVPLRVWVSCFPPVLSHGLCIQCSTLYLRSTMRLRLACSVASCFARGRPH